MPSESGRYKAYRQKPTQVGTARPERRRLATAQDVSEYIGLPLQSLYDRTRKGLIPGAVKIGKRVLYDLDALENYLDAGGDYRFTDRAEP